MKLWQSLTGSPASKALDLDTWASYFNYLGNSYPLQNFQQTLTSKEVAPDNNFVGYATQLYKRSGVVAAAMYARGALFKQATLKFRRQRDGRPGELFGNQDLALFEEPWPGGSTSDLLARMIQDVDLAGNSFIARKQHLHRLRPDWVTIVLGSNEEPDQFDPNSSEAEVIAYIYQPGGNQKTSEPELFTPDQIAHFMPLPDPLNQWRGMSWLTPIVREVMADSATTNHRLGYLESGATPSTVITMDKEVQREAFEKWVEIFEREHVGSENAFKTIYLAGGAELSVVGSDLRRMDFANVQSGGELRIVSASGVPPMLIGVKGGLDAGTLANFGQSRRLFADLTMRPLWRDAAGSLSRLVDVPLGTELWYDARDIPFLQDDTKDEAEVQEKQAAAISSLVTSGFTADSAVAAVVANDFSLLEDSGLRSVQLLPPGTESSPNGSAERVPAAT